MVSAVASACLFATVMAAPAPASRGADTTSGARACPVTLPDGAPAQGPNRFGYRQGSLWVQLWPYGITLVGKSDVASNGWLEVKVPWYRFAKGRLTISAARLDKPSAPARSHVFTGYGLTGFQASTVSFPSEGCWKIVGTVDRTKLSYVTIILRTRTVHQETPNG